MYETRATLPPSCLISNEIRTIDDFIFRNSSLFSKLSGFVLVAGPAGHGKSTLAAIVQAINLERTEDLYRARSVLFTRAKYH